MKAGRKFWCTWKDNSHSILIIQVFYAMEFRKIFKDPKMTIHKNDKFWMGSIKLNNEDILTEGFYTFYHTNELKGRILSAAGTMILQICYDEIELYIPVDENMMVGEIQNLISEYINMAPNKFIMTGNDRKENIYLINVDDNILMLMKTGIERFYVHEHNYDVNFLSYRILPICLKKLQFYNQKFDFHLYIHDQMSVNLLKQILFNRVQKLFDTNIGLEFETTNGIIFDDRIVATLKK
jgi:hypothetical protein